MAISDNNEYMKIFIICFLGLILSGEIHASSLMNEKDSVQNIIDTKLSKIDTPSHFELYSTFLSKIAYLGRYYGTNGVGFYPTIAYVHESGLNASISNNIWTGFSPVFNQSDINLGYNKTLGSWFGLGLGYSRTFMYYGSDSDKMSMPNSLNLNVGAYLNWVNIGFDYSYMFGYDKASAFHLGLTKDFIIYKFLKSDKVTISPGLGGYWASQAVFYHYFSKKAVQKINHGKSTGKGKGKNNNGTNSSTTTTSESVKVQALDYRINIPVDYRAGHFTYEIAAHLDIPVNLPIDYLYGTNPLITFTGYIKYTF